MTGQQLAAQWIVSNVRVGDTFRWLDLKNAFTQISQIDRRGRELRTLYGWTIHTRQEDRYLKVGEVRLVSVGSMP